MALTVLPAGVQIGERSLSFAEGLRAIIGGASLGTLGHAFHTQVVNVDVQTTRAIFIFPNSIDMVY